MKAAIQQQPTLAADWKVRAPARRYWRSLDEVARTKEFVEFLHREFPDGASEWLGGLDRRHFLKFIGASLALAAYPRLARTPSAPNVAASGLDCALSLPADHPRRAELVAALDKITRAVAEDLTLSIAADDRSGVYITLLDARKDAHDSTGARATAEAWSAFLDGEAAKAKTPDARMVFDPHRLSAYIELGQPERAIPMLETSERDAPGDYNPPARLALAYKAMKHWKEALAASDRALKRAYGPRTLTFYSARTDIYLGMADSLSARRTLREAVTFAEALPPGQRSDGTIAAFKKRLAAVGGAPPP